MRTFVQAHPETLRLFDAMQRCLDSAAAWNGWICRATTLKYANSRDLLSGKGAKDHGGRWNPKGGFASVYGALEPATAIEETLGHYRRAGIPFSVAMPLVLIAVEGTLGATLDLTDGKLRQRIRVSEKTMRTCDWKRAQHDGVESVTQALGRIAFELKLEGILVPSSVLAGATILVAFPDNFRRGSQLRIDRVEDLPQPGVPDSK